MDPSAPAVSSIMDRLGMTPDDWQREILQGDHSRLLLNCCRQAGKSTVVAAYAVQRAQTLPNVLVLLVSPSLRQSTELFRLVKRFHSSLAEAPPQRQTAQELVLANDSRI